MCHLTHMGAITLPYTVKTTVLQECEGATEKGLRLTLSVNNEAGPAWLEDAVAYAFAATNRNRTVRGCVIQRVYRQVSELVTG